MTSARLSLLTLVLLAASQAQSTPAEPQEKRTEKESPDEEGGAAGT